MNFTAIQLWEKAPDRYESHIHTHDGLHALLTTKAKRDLIKKDLLKYKRYPFETHTTTTSNKGLGSVIEPVEKRQTSSLLVFSAYDLDIPAPTKTPLIKIPRKQCPVRLLLTCLIASS